MLSRFFLLIGVLTLGLALACGGGGEKATTSPKATASPSGGATASGATATPKATAASEAAREFADLAKKAKSASYKAKYKVDFKSPTGEPVTGTMTFILKPPKTRFDAEMKGIAGDLAGSVTMISADDAGYMCVAAQRTCLKVPKSQIESAAPSFSDILQGPEEILQDPAKYSLTKAGSKNIAGARATCWKAADPGTKSEGEFCLSGEGVMLSASFKGTDQGQGTLEATEYSTRVSDDDFKPPYQVQELPNVPGLPPGIPGVPGR